MPTGVMDAVSGLVVAPITPKIETPHTVRAVSKMLRGVKVAMPITWTDVVTVIPRIT
jgi:hypothetical protein